MDALQGRRLTTALYFPRLHDRIILNLSGEYGYGTVPLSNWLSERQGAGRTHAIKAAREDRYGNFLNYIPQSLDVNQASLIEMEYTNNRIVKLVYRLSLTKGFDVVIVVVPTEYPWAVKTVFINERGDKHSTLNRSKYTIPSLA
jgi:hypothetical protein